MNIRPQLSGQIKRVVVKIGSAGVTEGQGPNLSRIQNLAREVQHLMDRGHEVILVSSGSINAGRPYLTEESADEMSALQALSAIGQPKLMAGYQKAFDPHNLTVAQVLLTHDDMGNRHRSLNLRNTIIHLLQARIVPIVNENDSVSYAEITVGDNDQLAAMVAQVIDADLLVLLTGPKGLYTGDPQSPDSKIIREVAADDSLEHVNTKGKSNVGRGGMQTKLEAVRRVTPLGIPAIITTYDHLSPVISAIEGEGTLFHPAKSSDKGSRKRWIRSSAKPNAAIQVDQGASEALKKGASVSSKAPL